MTEFEAPPRSIEVLARRDEVALFVRILPVRMLINAQFRIVYPFLPAIGRGLGVPLETAALLVAFRAAFGAVSPLFGYLADRFGRKRMMVAGALALMIGAGLVAAAPTFGLVLAGFGLLGIAQSAYDPAMQAHVSEMVPEDRRGRALGIVELSWALSWLIGVPATGFLMARWGWQSPFAVIAILAGVCVWLTLTVRGAVRHAHTAPHDGQVRAPALPRPVLCALAASALILFANEALFIVYGALMEDRFGLALGVLGAASVVVSLAELMGASAVVTLVDRIGKRRALIGGLLVNAVCFSLLPVVGVSLPLALAGLAAVALTSEFSIVTSIPLLSGLADRSRGFVMAVRTALMWGMVIVGSFVAPRLWHAYGLPAVAATSATAVLSAALLVWRGVRADALQPDR